MKKNFIVELIPIAKRIGIKESIPRFLSRGASLKKTIMKKQEPGERIMNEIMKANKLSELVKYLRQEVRCKLKALKSTNDTYLHNHEDRERQHEKGFGVT
jgi:hypothetical protein